MTIGHYRIEAQLGAGGMGIVYRAYDTVLQRTVAVKVLSERLQADEAARARLLREARSASALNHPSVCTIHEVGEASGQAFIVMEYVEGSPLSDLVPEDGLPADTAIRHATQIADALAHAHDRGIVHRDLKASNVIVTPEGRVKVLDFGLAKKLRDVGVSETTHTNLTEAGVVVGTLSYIPPEVLRGEDADARSDLWALGVLLYKLVTGRPPFAGQTGFELSSAILREPPAPLPARVPAALRAIIQRCLAKEPGQRYQRAGEVRAALESLESGSITAPAPAIRSQKTRWLWAIAPVLLASVALALYLQNSKVAPPPAPVDRVEVATASANAEANEYLQKALLFMLARPDLSRARDMLEKALALDPRFAEARAVYGFTHFLVLDQGLSSDTGWFFKAEQELRRALQDNPNSATAHASLAGVYLAQGRKDLVQAEVDKALAVSPKHADALHWLGHFHCLNGDTAAALRLWKQVTGGDPLFWPARMAYGDTLRQQGNTAQAIQELEKILEQDPQHIYATRFLARVYLDIGDLAKARQTLDRGRPEDRESYYLRIQRALLAALEENRAEALRLLNQDVLKIAAAYVLNTSEVADVYAVLGDTAKGLEWLDQAVRLGDERAAWFRRDPLMANLRDQPRFKQILGAIEARRGKP